jgi:hypothetical protein
MTTQRYDILPARMCEEDGEYVLYTDHLAEVEQWKRIIVTHVDVIAEKEKRIAALQAELTAVKASKLVFVPELSDDMKDTEIERLEDRVKELEGALEKYGSHSPADGSPICERSKHSDYPCTCGFEAALGGEG